MRLQMANAGGKWQCNSIPPAPNKWLALAAQTSAWRHSAHFACQFDGGQGGGAFRLKSICRIA